jgi:cardiolipin synthase
MELTLLLNLITVVVALYVISASVFLILDNRSPQSTFAWLFLFILLPVVGVIIYVFIGRDWKAFSHERKLIRQEIGGELIGLLKPLQAQEKKVIERLARDKPAAFKHKLLQLVNKNSTSLLTGYNELEILQDAAEKYPRLLADLQEAQQAIHMEYYIWTDDDFTRQVKEVLIDRAKAGVEVRCLYDASGGKLSYNYRRELEEAGVRILPYLEYRSLTRLHTINYRSHRKIVIIDGRIGYVGGLNLDQAQLDGGKYFNSWRDTHLRIRGEAALALQAIFLVSWFNTTQEKLLDAAYFPPVDKEINTFLPVQITTAGPDSQWGAIRQLYFYMIMSAQKKVYIQSPFFIPDESISEAIKAVALAGVQVKLMCAPPRDHLHHPLLGGQYLLCRFGPGRGRNLSLSKRVFPSQNAQYRRRHLHHRHGQYGYPQLYHQLRGQRRHLRRNESQRTGAGLQE